MRPQERKRNGLYLVPSIHRHIQVDAIKFHYSLILNLKLRLPAYKYSEIKIEFSRLPPQMTRKLHLTSRPLSFHEFFLETVLNLYVCKSNRLTVGSIS